MASNNDPEPDVDAEAGQHGGVQSVDRALAVLEILARDGHAGVSEIAEEMGIHKSTVSRLLGSLVSREMVHQNSERGKYQLGFGILRLASSIPGRLSLVREARPVLESLAEEYKETVNLAVLRSNYAVNVDQAMGPSTLATYDWVGSLTPLHATSSGKVLLAALSADERDSILKETGLPARTPRTITRREQAGKPAARRRPRLATAVTGGVRDRAELHVRAGVQPRGSGDRRGQYFRPGLPF